MAFRSQTLRRSTFRNTAIAVAGIGLGLCVACKTGGGTKRPGKSGENREQKIAAAQKHAKVVGLVDLANNDLEQGRYLSAIKRANEALADDPRSADAYTILGAAHWRQGTFDASTAAYRQAVDIDPSHFGGALGLARNLQTVGKHGEAIAVADTLLKDDPKQIEPLIVKLYSHYAICDAKGGVETLDKLFQILPEDEPRLPVIQFFAAVLRPLADVQGLCEVAGKKGASDAFIDDNLGLKYSGATVGGKFTRAVIAENRDEARIDSALAKSLKLKPVAKLTPYGDEEERELVVIPEIKFGDLALKNVPAIVQPLSGIALGDGDTAGILLGFQALHGVRTMTFDFPQHSLAMSTQGPGDAAGVELPFLLISLSRLMHAPAVPVRVDGAEHEFYAYLGGVFPAGVAVTSKHYLKSGHLPRELEGGDEERGWKMVLVDELAVGGEKLEGTGGIVLTNTPADAGLEQFLTGAGFELGGYVTTALMHVWTVTYDLPEGKVFIKARPAGK